MKKEQGICSVVFDSLSILGKLFFNPGEKKRESQNNSHCIPANTSSCLSSSLLTVSFCGCKPYTFQRYFFFFLFLPERSDISLLTPGQKQTHTWKSKCKGIKVYSRKWTERQLKRYLSVSMNWKCKFINFERHSITKGKLQKQIVKKSNTYVAYWNS